MKMKKMAAVLLAFTVTAGSAGGCSTDSSASKTATSSSAWGSQAQTTALPVETSAPSETTAGTLPPDIAAPAKGVTDTDKSPILIFSWNTDFKDLLDKYYVPLHPNFKYDYRVTTHDQYQANLDKKLASDTGAPDIFLVESDYSKKYTDSGSTMNINELGISNSELSGSYPYTYNYAKNEAGALKAVCMTPNPSGVFYNRTLANTYIGSDDPAVVGKYFATWKAFLAMAKDVSKNSKGAVKAVSGFDDIWPVLRSSHSKPWIIDGKVAGQPDIEMILGSAKTFMSDSLSFETAMNSTKWKENMSNSSVLSFWGSLTLLNAMNFGYEADGTTIKAGANPTTGDWAFCPAPVSCFGGDIWLAASRDDNNKATTADIMRFFAIDQASLTEMAKNGKFVNNSSVMKKFGAAPEFVTLYLGGQNPMDLLCREASKINVSGMTSEEHIINTIFASTVSAYVTGKFTAAAIAEQAFVLDCADAGIGMKR